MSVEKAVLKLAIFNEMMEELVDARLEADAERLRQEGGMQVCQALVTNIEGLQARAAKRAEDEGWELEQLGKVKKFLQMAIRAAMATHEASAIRMTQNQGKIQALEQRRLSLLEKYELEDRKARASLEDSNGRQVGEHPGDSLASQRKAEAAEESAVDADESVEE